MSEQTPSKELSVGEFNVTVIPAQLSANFIELEARLDALLDKDRVVVTLENLQDQKKRNASLNKLAAEVKDKVNEVIAAASIHIDPFKANGKRLVDKILAVRAEADEQVKAFEQATKDACLALLLEELNIQWALQSITNEFRKADISGLVKLTAMTDAGNLTKATLAEVENRAKQDKAQQILVESRLMALENKCLKADINPPLSRASVEAFLFDDRFETRLDALIAAEVARKAEAEDRMRKKLEAEKQRDIDAALARQKAELEACPEPVEVASNRQEAKNYVLPVVAAMTDVIADPDTKVPFTVTVKVTKTYVYDIETKKGTDIDKIKRHYQAKHEGQGDAVSVEVVRHNKEVAA